MCGSHTHLVMVHGAIRSEHGRARPRIRVGRAASRPWWRDRTSPIFRRVSHNRGAGPDSGATRHPDCGGGLGERLDYLGIVAIVTCLRGRCKSRDGRHIGNALVGVAHGLVGRHRIGWKGVSAGKAFTALPQARVWGDLSCRVSTRHPTTIASTPSTPPRREQCCGCRVARVRSDEMQWPRLGRTHAWHGSHPRNPCICECHSSGPSSEWHGAAANNAPL